MGCVRSSETSGGRQPRKICSTGKRKPQQAHQLGSSSSSKQQQAAPPLGGRAWGRRRRTEAPQVTRLLSSFCSSASALPCMLRARSVTLRRLPRSSSSSCCACEHRSMGWFVPAHRFR